MSKLRNGQVKGSRIVSRGRMVRRREAPGVYPTGGLATVTDACEFLNCSKSTIYDMLRLGILKKCPLIKQFRIPWSSLWEFVEKEPPALGLNSAL